MDNNKQPSINFEKMREYVWNGKIGVQFTLPEEYLADKDKPKPLYFMIPRYCYLGFYYDKVDEYFKSYKLPNSDIWFSYEEIPLHWHVPFGVLIDMLFGAECKPIIELKVHCMTPPADKLVTGTAKLTEGSTIPLFGLKTCQDHYLHSLKEAAKIRFGNLNFVLTTPADEKKKMWDSIESDIMERYNSMFKSFWVDRTALDIAPVRIFVKGIPQVLQKAVKLKNEKSEEILLGQFIETSFPKVTFKWPDQPFSQENQEKVKCFQVLNNGIEMDYSVTISFLADNLFSLDGFVYLSITSL
jgi:autophagy-related protein 5